MQIIPIINFQASQMRLSESVCAVVCAGWLLFLQQCNTERWGEKVEQSISVLCFNQQIRW